MTTRCVSRNTDNTAHDGLVYLAEEPRAVIYRSFCGECGDHFNTRSNKTDHISNRLEL